MSPREMETEALAGASVLIIDHDQGPALYSDIDNLRQVAADVLAARFALSPPVARVVAHLALIGGAL